MSASGAFLSIVRIGDVKVNENYHNRIGARNRKDNGTWTVRYYYSFEK